MRLREKVAIITGGAQGRGRAYALLAFGGGKYYLPVNCGSMVGLPE
jgi:NAD(P)-dependent dehydrogenase (short-subunit alcohol dehydrogenase family)